VRPESCRCTGFQKPGKRSCARRSSTMSEPVAAWTHYAYSFTSIRFRQISQRENAPLSPVLAQTSAPDIPSEVYRLGIPPLSELESGTNCRRTFGIFYPLPWTTDVQYISLSTPWNVQSVKSSFMPSGSNINLL